MMNPEDLSRWAKALRDLGSAGAMILLVLFLVYMLAMKIQPALEAVPAIAADLKAHRRAEQSTLQSSQQTCVAVKALARQDAGTCLSKQDLVPDN